MSPVEHVFIKGSIGDKPLNDELFNIYYFDIVVNLAAQAGVRYSIDHSDAYIESNIIGFYSILEACRRYPVEYLVYASSSFVYGGNKKEPFSTEDRVDNPVSLYVAPQRAMSFWHTLIPNSIISLLPDFAFHRIRPCGVPGYVLLFRYAEGRKFRYCPWKRNQQILARIGVHRRFISTERQMYLW